MEDDDAAVKVLHVANIGGRVPDVLAGGGRQTPRAADLLAKVKVNES